MNVENIAVPFVDDKTGMCLRADFNCHHVI